VFPLFADRCLASAALTAPVPLLRQCAAPGA
jgi:hypothetical protein